MQTNETLKAVAAKLGVSEEKAVKIAINRLYIQLFHQDQDFEFPTPEQIQQAEAAAALDPAWHEEIKKVTSLDEWLKKVEAFCNEHGIEPDNDTKTIDQLDDEQKTNLFDVMRRSGIDPQKTFQVEG
jgi:hypothetical protein